MVPFDLSGVSNQFRDDGGLSARCGIGGIGDIGWDGEALAAAVVAARCAWSSDAARPHVPDLIRLVVMGPWSRGAKRIVRRIARDVWPRSERLTADERWHRLPRTVQARRDALAMRADVFALEVVGYAAELFEPGGGGRDNLNRACQFAARSRSWRTLGKTDNRAAARNANLREFGRQIAFVQALHDAYREAGGVPPPAPPPVLPKW